MTEVTPISDDQQREVIARVNYYLALAGRCYGQRFDSIPVHFDLKGKMAGMYRVKRRERVIRFNPWLFAKYYQESLDNTVPHEVAHYVADKRYGLGRIRPHGAEWQSIMVALGAEPRATGRYSLKGIPTRQVRQFSYRCGCREHQLSAYRHNRICGGRATYLCRSCGGHLKVSAAT